MYLKIIEDYINKLTKEDIILFAFNNNIILKPIESDYLYKTIKLDYKKLLSNNYNEIFEKAKEYINQNNLEKLYNLFLEYRIKYQKYLKKIEN